MPCIFKAKTQEGYIIKVLGELLQHIIKTGCFVLDKNGITLRMMDSHRKKLVDLRLEASKFSIYKFKTDTKFLGINLGYFYKMLKSIKKKDGVVLFIDEAYALGNSEKRDSFAKECIDTLCEGLSNHKENLMVIIAGYEKELKECFFSYNQGLDSRFNWRYKTDNYNHVELYKIFKKKVNEIGWTLSDKVTEEKNSG